MFFFPEGRTGEAWKPCVKQCSLRNRGALDTTRYNTAVRTTGCHNAARISATIADTPLPRGVHYNLNIPNGGHTPCTTTPISLVDYVIKRPFPATVTQTDHKSII